MADEQQVCPHCGNFNRTGARFCSKCGHDFKLSAVPQQLAEPSASPATPPTAEAASSRPSSARTRSSSCAATTQTAATGLSRHKNLELLVAFYTEGYAVNDINRMTQGIRKAIEFYWRTTEGNLNFDPTFLYIDAPLPADIWSPEVEADLRASVEEVRTLRGIIPICATCKKVREGADWTRIDAYVQQHTEAQFSHGICPECRGRIYPGVRRPDSPPAPAGL